MNSFEKQKIAIRYWMLGKGFHNAVSAMTLAETYHTGFRADGTTPEFSHQVAIANYLRTLETSLMYPEETLITAFLHDIREDYNLSDEVIRFTYGDIVADAVDAMTKVYNSKKRDQSTQFQRIAESPVASIAKAADRVHNHQTMVGVFTPSKIDSYVAETVEFFMPMLKTARRLHPRQEQAYENAKLVLTSQMELIAAVQAYSTT